MHTWNYYTIPRTTGELQLDWRLSAGFFYYTIPRTTGELQPGCSGCCKYHRLYHTKNHRGTTTSPDCPHGPTVIIPYQEPPGNYNARMQQRAERLIIPYQEPPGNYNVPMTTSTPAPIIPYQEPPGNYNECDIHHIIANIIPYQEPRQPNYTLIKKTQRTKRTSFKHT